MENRKQKTENVLPESFRFRFSVFRFFVFLCFCVLLFPACGDFKKPAPEPFYAETAPPQIKEFRWSNGKMPKSFDPAMAYAPPETDVVRAIYEGLTDTNPKTLETVPAIALEWSSSDDNRIWTFKLRRDAKWSNGERITAADFVRSWKRLAALGDKVPHFQLFNTIVGMQAAKTENSKPHSPEELNLFERKIFNQGVASILKPTADQTIQQKPEIKSPIETKPAVSANNSLPQTKPDKENAEETGQKTQAPVKSETEFGAAAIDDFTLKVSLVKPDKDFPALVAHPIFRPVYADGKYFETGKLNADIVTNGAFRIAGVSPADGITLERAENYWNKKQIELERVRFVPMENAEKALAAYRAGDIDAVTNVEFEPLALKLLMPFDDFQRTTHSALNFYEFNTEKPPFNDRRVREALTIAIERERLTEDDMDGASVPALSFSPFDKENIAKLPQNIERAKTLLADAGFTNGDKFPTVRLIINRNNMQQRIAHSVAKMWKQNLNISTEIVVKEQAEIDTAKQTGDFDILRRGVVLPTTDEAVNMLAIFTLKVQTETAEEYSHGETLADDKKTGEDDSQHDASVPENPSAGETSAENSPKENLRKDAAANAEILTESEAVHQIPAIPLYFPTSYSLVKPYIQGFETNALDAPSLKDVRIDNDWQTKKTKGES